MQPKEMKIKNENGSAFLRAKCSLLAEAPFPLYSLSCPLHSQILLNKFQ